ncbi:MAG: DEAD/DEAH box helicase [Cyanobacteria bacterium P01_D01_bin.1]
MIPSIVATQVRNCVSDYLRTTFRPTTPGFEGLLDRFIDKPENIGRGPYVSIGLPFRPGTRSTSTTGNGSGSINGDFFPHIPLGFTPHLHQERAFTRLSPPYYQSTLIATGTGSGKTECFLLPLLEHCRQQANTSPNQGIKAILVYPMNALATDQAKRIAALIHNTPSLNNKVTAGLYIGDKDDSPSPTMGPNKVITDKQVIRNAPPDLLLTNYKMLDYLLVQPESQKLWRYNQPDTLRYIIVDEFHTFDGAQGTDLACLLRRLKHRLKTPRQHLACVGTSATLGSASNKADMLRYAETIFQESFDDNALIEEDRVSAGEFLHDALLNMLPVPGPAQIDELQPEAYATPEAYLLAQAKLWLQNQAPEPTAPDTLTDDWRLALGQELKTLPIVHNLLRILADGPCDYAYLLEKFGQRLNLITNDHTDYPHRLLDSLLSLIAAARQELPQENGDRVLLPWVTLRVQHWFRELKRMVASLEPEPNLLFSDDLTPEKLQKTLPVLHCRDCGATGWGGVRPSVGANRLESGDLKRFYQNYFAHKPLVAYVFPCDETEPDFSYLCPECLSISGPKAKRCRSCGHEKLLRVHIPNILSEESFQGKKRSVSSHDCPYCNSSSGLSIIGAQAASLTSAMIGVLYATPFNQDKKLLTFSDSVQDAAHRAGFYGARTYRTTLRTAIARTILAHPEGLSLAELTQQFPQFWQQRLGTTSYVSTFLPTDLEWLREWDDFVHSDRTTLATDSRLPSIVNERLTWEIVNQFGHRSAIGPSLERSGLCATQFSPSAVATAAKQLHLTLTNEIEALRDVPAERIHQFLLGLLHHLRDHGGILQPATVDTGYLSNGGNTFLLQKPTYMPRLGPTVPTPVFLVNASAKVQSKGQSRSQSFEQVINPGNRSSWSEDWTQRLLASETLLLKEQIIEVLHHALETFVSTNLLEEKTCGDGRAWGIPTTTLSILPEAKVLACDRCSHQLTATPAEQDFLTGMTCLSQGCQGHYQPDSRIGLSYYRNLYQKGEVHRIVAAEHTGLLARPSREWLEKRFIEHQRRCDPNLISATSTLEMGINIGDLSTVLLCSVPPAVSSFQQRIGRAGRRDGNALVGIVANGKPHDLHFYDDPMRMVNGNVEAAGCYLDASAILQRQLTAFCLDTWVAIGITRQQFSPKLSEVLNAIERSSLDRFPYNWLSYIKTHQGELLETFLRLFKDTITDQTRAEIRTFMEKGEQDEGGLRWQILNRLEGVRQERTRLSSQIKNIGGKIKKYKENPAALQDDEHLGELERERTGFRALMKELNKKHILNFLTDEGLLPNYAFPEAGVTLRSILWRQKQPAEQSNGKKYETFTLTYERPGALAIRELVPSGVFYAEGRKVKIDQIDLKLSEPEDWRICRSCNYAIQAIEPEANDKTCPRCGDAMWSDQGQLRRMLRLRQVMATTSDKGSRFGDDSEDRNSSFFQRHLLVDFDPAYREKTFLVKEKVKTTEKSTERTEEKEFPFGFEYISQTTFREINLGESLANGESVSLAGQKFTTHGFKVCRSCGKVMRGKGDKFTAKDHMINCQWRDKPEQTKAIDVLYLYREFRSEAIRFLMPDEKFWTPQGLHSFIAALQLGLKRKFGGKVDHLRTLISEEPQPGSSLRKSFLYLYDSIPGGTGYLRQLIRDPNSLGDVFNQALAVLRSCGCEDGCYSCLFAYRNSFDQDQTSRKWARDLLGTIAKHWPQLEETSEGLSAIRLNSNFESELERRFIEAIRQYSGKAYDGATPQLRNDIINGQAGYYLKVNDRAWIIQTQVPLGPSDGVDIPSRADFVLRPASTRVESKPIVVFTDGWEYHKDRIGEDLQQRLAIIRSGQFHCWSLTWDDIAAQLEPAKIAPPQLDGLTCQLNDRFLQGQIQVYQQYQCADLQPLEQLNSFEWLMNYLAQPDAEQWQRWAMLRTFAQANPVSLKDATLKQQWSEQIQAQIGIEPLDYWDLPEQFLNVKVPVSSALTIWSAVDLARHRQTDAAGSFVLLALDDAPSAETARLKAGWNETLRLLNLYQFLPHAYACTPTLDSSPTSVLLPKLFTAQSTTIIPAPPWQELKELVLEEALLPAIAQMQQSQWSLPEVGYELTNSRGTVVAIAELAWSDHRIAVVLTASDRTTFSNNGWLAISPEELSETFDTLSSKLTECQLGES